MAYTLKELYNIWCFLPLIVTTQHWGSKNKEKNALRLQRLGSVRSSLSLQQEWKPLYREMGAYLAASSFITHTSLYQCVRKRLVWRHFTRQTLSHRYNSSRR